MTLKASVLLYVLAVVTAAAASEPTKPPAPIAIYLQTEPLLQKKGENFQVHVGMRIFVRAEVKFEDGSRRDVTKDPKTVFVSIDKKAATVTKDGEVTFLSTHGELIGHAAAAVVYNGKVGDVLNFIVHPRADPNR